MSDEARALAGDILHSLCGYDCAADGVSEDEYNTDIETLAAALQREREGAGRDVGSVRKQVLEEVRDAQCAYCRQHFPFNHGVHMMPYGQQPECRSLTVRKLLDNAIQGDAAQGEGEGCYG